MKNKQLLLLIFLFCSLLSKGQSDFRPGYVVNMSGDTLLGEIDYRGDKFLGKNCKFRLRRQEKDTMYTPTNILAYQFENSRFFVSKEYAGVPVFVEYLIKGKMNIFYYRDDKKDHYFVEKEGGKFLELPFDKGIKYVGEVPYYYKTKEHFLVLSNLLLDAPQLNAELAEIREPNRENLVELAENYHNTVCKNEQCIIYERKLPMFKVSFELLGGIVNYRYWDEIQTKYYFQTGFLAHVWMPRANERIYFKTGLFYSYADLDTETTDIREGSSLKIPLQVEYIYSKKRMQYKIAIGYDLYSIPNYIDFTYPIVLGVNIQLHKQMYLSLNYDIEFYHSAILPAGVFSHSFLTGVYFKF